MRRAQETVSQSVLFPSDDFKIIITENTTSNQDKAFHEAIEIKVFVEGRSMVMIDSDVIIAEQGDITVSNPYEVHASIESNIGCGKYYLLMVDLDFFADSGPGDIDLRRELLVKGKRICHHIKDQPRLCEMVFRAYEELRGEDKYYKSVIKAIMCELFASLLRCNLQSVRANEPDSDTVKYNLAILPALQRIFSDYKVQLTVDELAELCGISKYHFCRIFKRQMGCTVMQYIMNYRISLAELMLKENSHSIKEIADMCGFEDVSYFHRCYKRIKGVTPSKVRI